MYVDDDPDDCEIFCDALKASMPEAECLYSVNGEAAIDLLNGLSHLPDYIFMDINMPKMNGKECLTKIKDDSKLKDIPVLMVSTTTFLMEKPIYTSLGATDFIVKPSAIGELAGILKTVLK